MNVSIDSTAPASGLQAIVDREVSKHAGVHGWAYCLEELRSTLRHQYAPIMPYYARAWAATVINRFDGDPSMSGMFSEAAP